MQYRLANNADIPQLATLRWQFRQDDDSLPDEIFAVAFSDFLQRGFDRDNWVVWLAEVEGVIISHIYIQIIEKVPKPSRLHDAYGYVTNVYTRPAYRGQGIGSALLAHVKQWAHAQDIEFLLVWPSTESEAYYKRAGFTFDEITLEYEVRPYED